MRFVFITKSKPAQLKMPPSNASARIAVLLAALLCTLQVREVASRDIVCDDGTTLSTTCSFILPNPENTTYCLGPKILALKRGCFECVDPTTCDSSGFSASVVLASDPESAEALETPSRDELVIDKTPVEARFVPAEVVMMPAHRPEQDAQTEKGLLIYPQQAAAEAPLGRMANPQVMREVSNWYFLVPACLALVSVGLALRGQIERTRQEFERVNDDDHDEINPFCDDEANPQADDDSLECGQHYDSDEAMMDRTQSERNEL